MGSLRVTVPLSQIRASGTNPREDMGDLDRLAESIEATGGEPINPPVVVMDGNTYRLVDGERRFRALCRLYEDDESHLVTVLAYDDYDEAMSAVAMIATDDKKQLTDEERARGTQTVLKLDVPEEQAAKALHTDVEGVRKARRSRKRLGERAETMSMADLLVFAQEDWTAPEMEELMKAQASSYDTVEGCAKRLMSHRRAEERFQGMVDMLVDIEFEDVPKPSGWEPLLTATSAKALREGLDGLEDGHEGLKAFRAPYNERALVVCQESDPDAVPERDVARETVDRATSAQGRVVAGWARQLAARVQSADGLQARGAFPKSEALDDLVGRYRAGSSDVERLSQMTDEADVDIEIGAYLDTPTPREVLIALANGLWCGEGMYNPNRVCSIKYYNGSKTPVDWNGELCDLMALIDEQLSPQGIVAEGDDAEWLLGQCREHRDE